ncbi:glycosyltransferase family 2 protein [Polaromonas sp.]|uniref:glycosyltransferase family 2 protein n=1 Tax=Polaromonas sp. TaxID=1869339 RepID=UPI003BB6A463
MKLSALLIVSNEASNLEACIQSVSWADECVVLEHGSTDNTVEIAGRLDVKFSQTPDWPGFGPQKNRALDAASGDWILSIDADERVTPALAIEIKDALKCANVTGQRVAFEIPRRTQFCGTWIRHCGWTPDHVLRLFKRDEGRFSNDKVHEKVLLTRADTKVVRLKNPLLHYSYPSSDHYWRKLQHYSQEWARQRYARGQTATMTRAALAAVAAFLRSYVFRLGFLDGAMGFAVCTMQAQSAFGKYFELYCLGRKNEK